MDGTPADFYQSHLDRVSRSFAFCIQQLPQPLHDWVGLSYLLCRIVDTVEDSAWADESSQLKIFQRFDRALVEAQAVDELLGWQGLFPEISEHERLLLVDAHRLLTDFHHLPPQIYEIIRELVLSMSQGMQHFCRHRQNGDLRLSTLVEVNQYCFFVAGLVGELLAKLIANIEPKFQTSQLNILRAHHFGQFLQKVNLLKDQVTDERLGRHLIPSRELVEGSAGENAEQALNFLLQLPKEQIEFRRFCAWSLFLGLEALSVARDSVLSQRVIKVPRSEMQSILAAVEGALDDDEALRELFATGRNKLGWAQFGEPLASRTAELPKWLLALYHGPLDSQSLHDLGLTS
jgi:phytoene/squalene synthetase